MTTDSRDPQGKPRRPNSASRLHALELALQSQRLEMEGHDLVRALLPLLDHVESVCRGYDQLPLERQRERAESVGKLAEMADSVVGELGLERIGAVGERADRDLHNVVDTKTGGHAPRGSIVEVLKYGWRHSGKVLRQAQVVAAISEQEGESETGP